MKILVISAVALCGAGLLIAGVRAQEDPSHAWFTGEQAAEGRVVFNAHCAACHGQSVFDIFATYPDAAAFYDFISGSMPRHAPASLDPQEYVDIVAFIMDGIGFPAGAQKLPPDRYVLVAIDPSSVPRP